MPHISLKDEADARQRWSFEDTDGRVYVAKSVSRPALIDWLIAVGEAGTDAKKHEKALHDLLRVAFPAKWSYVWRTDPVLRLLHLGIEERERVLESFFAVALPTEIRSMGPTITTNTPSPSSADVTRSDAER
jgi:hypothetical protein